MCRRALEASAELGYGHLALLHHIPFAEVLQLSHTGLVSAKRSSLLTLKQWLGNPTGGVRREDGGFSGGGGRQVPVPAARPPANAGAVAEMRRT